MTGLSLGTDNWLTIPVTRGYIDLLGEDFEIIEPAKPHVQAFVIASGVAKVETVGIHVDTTTVDVLVYDRPHVQAFVVGPAYVKVEVVDGDD